MGTIGCELEVLVLNGEGKPVTREEFLEIVNEVLGGRPIFDPCTREVVGVQTGKNIVLKTDTTSMIWEFSLPPSTSLNDVLNMVERSISLINELGFRVYPRAYYPNPGLQWYSRNVSPRGHYRLLQWYGYKHWKIASMASTQIWIEVEKEKLPKALSIINAISPALLFKFSNSECCSWREYRVELWRQFAEDSWASIPRTWLPKLFRNWTDILNYVFSGKLQEASNCKDLSGYTLKELATELEEREGRALGRTFDMKPTTIESHEIIGGMQRWMFNPAIPRWTVSRVPPNWLSEHIRGNVDPFLKSLDRTFIEVRFLPSLATSIEKLRNVMELILQILDNDPMEIEVSEDVVQQEYISAAKGFKPVLTSEILEKLLRK